MPALTAQAIREEIERLIPLAETGEQWADICELEAEMIELQKQEDEANSQFGVGA